MKVPQRQRAVDPKAGNEPHSKKPVIAFAARIVEIVELLDWGQPNSRMPAQNFINPACSGPRRADPDKIWTD
jgi:hypothetical protein